MMTKIAALFFLIFSIVPLQAENGPALIQSLIQKEYIPNDPYTKPFLKRVELLKLEGNYPDFAQVSDAMILRFYRVKDSESEARSSFLAIAESNKTKEPIGMFCVNIYEKGGEKFSSLDHVYFDRNFLGKTKAAGKIGTSILTLLDSDIYLKLGIRKEIIKADYRGRLVWARLGYQFKESYWLKDQGRLVRYPEMAQRNFDRFLKANGMSARNLKKPLETLRTPLDFANAVYKSGRKITLRPLEFSGELGTPKALPVGQAFMLADYRWQKGKFVISQAQTKFSPSAMPYWNGWREVGRFFSGAAMKTAKRVK